MTRNRSYVNPINSMQMRAQTSVDNEVLLRCVELRLVLIVRELPSHHPLDSLRSMLIQILHSHITRGFHQQIGVYLWA